MSLVEKMSNLTPYEIGVFAAKFDLKVGINEGSEVSEDLAEVINNFDELDVEDKRGVLKDLEGSSMDIYPKGYPNWSPNGKK